MGAGVSGSSSKREIPGYALFLDEELRLNCSYFVSSLQDREDFARVIKDGNWAEALSKGKLLHCRDSGPKLKEIEVDFTASSLQVMLASVGETLASSSSGSTRSSRCNSRDVQDNEFDFGGAGGLYTDIEARTCFNRDEMQSVLLSIIFPTYVKCKAKHTIRAAADPLLAHDHSGSSGRSSDSHMLGFEEGHLLSMQEMLLSAAAYADEHALAEALASLEWMNTLIKSVYFCPLHVCISAVDHSTGGITPVFINDASRKRLMVSGKSHRFAAADFLQLWSIVPEGTLLADVTESLRAAQPLRVISKPSFARTSRLLLDVTHIYNDEGKHCYVLGVQGECQAGRNYAAYERYVSDSALLISHMIKTNAPLPPSMPPTSPTTPTGVKTPLPNFGPSP
jgi:hypothetical protein